MNIEPVVFFDMALTIFILSIALVGMVFYLTHSLKKITTLGNSKNTSDKALRIIDDAKNHASDIINKANLSANTASDDFNQELAKLASSQLKGFEKATSEFIGAYGQVLNDLKIKNIEVFQNVSKDIETSAMSEIKNFRESVEKLTIASQKEVKKKIDADYDDLEKELESYRKEKLKEIDNKIYELLEKVSKLTLGKAISLSEHENLITKALEKAKKEGAFAK